MDSETTQMQFQLDGEARSGLMRIARAAVESAVRRHGGPNPRLIEQIRKASPVLGQRAGCFVTVYVGDNLRGCLGEIECTDSLIQGVIRCASRAPVADYRFNPVQPIELADVNLKISVLTPPFPLRSIDEIEIGKHGLIAEHQGRCGLLLPDVATEYAWDVSTFLFHLRRKAGISSNVPWEAIRLSGFTTELIASADHEPASRGAPVTD